jgi:hypothetical protein
MNTTQHDPISDYFTSEWTTERPMSPDFSSAVLKKITENRHREWLFNLMCIAIAATGIIAVLTFAYPQVFTTLADAARHVGKALIEAFSIQLKQPQNAFMSGLFIYLVILAAALWGLDRFLRKRRHLDITLCL